MGKKPERKRLILLFLVVMGFSFLGTLLLLDKKFDTIRDGLTPSELLDTCWEPGGRATYGPCPFPDYVIFQRNQFPLSVSIVMDEPIPFSIGVAEDNVQVAIEDMNNQLGFEAFRYEEFQMSNADVVVCWNVNLEHPTWLGTTRHFRRVENGQFFLRTRVNISERADYGNVYNIVFHELGHTIGLNHDAKITSPMYRFVSYGSTRLENDDVNILRQLYAPR